MKTAGLGRCAGQFLLALAVGVLLVGPSARAYQAAANDRGTLEPYEVIERRGLDVLDYLHPPKESLLWRKWFQASHPYSDTPWEMHGFPGVLGLSAPFLALIAYRYGRKEKKLWAMVPALGAGGIALFILAAGPHMHFAGHDLGIPMPYRLLYDWVPGFFALRVPARASVFVAMSLVALFAISIDRLSESVRRRSLFAFAFVISLVVSAAFADVAPGRLPYARSAEYEALHAAMVATDPGTPDEGTDLILPIREPINFAAPLASAPRFRKLVNGRSGYWPRSSERVLNELRAPFDLRQAALLRDLNVNRLFLDRTVLTTAGESVILETLRQTGCEAESFGAWGPLHVFRLKYLRPAEAAN